jgi:hypothetical protein
MIPVFFPVLRWISVERQTATCRQYVSSWCKQPCVLSTLHDVHYMSELRGYKEQTNHIKTHMVVKDSPSVSPCFIANVRLIIC